MKIQRLETEDKECPLLSRAHSKLVAQEEVQIPISQMQKTGSKQLAGTYSRRVAELAGTLAGGPVVHVFSC